MFHKVFYKVFKNATFNKKPWQYTEEEARIMKWRTWGINIGMLGLIGSAISLNMGKVSNEPLLIGLLGFDLIILIGLTLCGSMDILLSYEMEKRLKREKAEYESQNRVFHSDASINKASLVFSEGEHIQSIHEELNHILGGSKSDPQLLQKEMQAGDPAYHTTHFIEKDK